MKAQQEIEQRRARMAALPRLTGPRRLADLEGMTALDWERVYWAYQGFMTQVWAVVRDVQKRQREGDGR